MQKSFILTKDQPEIKLDFEGTNDKIITEIKQQASLIGNHGDINFAAVNQNSKVLDENIRKVWNIVSRIRKQQKEAAESQKAVDSHFNFRFFKVKKTSLVIAVLGLWVFILTLFCMKQQNDYALLNSRYHRQYITIREIRVELDSIRSVSDQKAEKKK